jgi:hypothetical protein
LAGYIVLSKLRYFSQPTGPTCSGDLHGLQWAIARRVEQDFGTTTLIPIVGGTLGICFRVDTVNKPFFLKTHRGGESLRENLLKEFDILKVLYTNVIHLEQFEVNISTDRRTCILMDWLDESPNPFTPTDVRAIVGACHQRLTAIPCERAAQFSTIAKLIDEGRHALLELERLRFISADTASRIQPYIAAINETAYGLQPLVCHGDLSNKNIMLSHGKNIVVDWEDAFLGFEGYDFLYWLTFMSNRRYISRSILGHTPLDEKSERGVLLTIVAIKSLISIRSGTIQSSHMPIEQRLRELLTF